MGARRGHRLALVRHAHAMHRAQRQMPDHRDRCATALHAHHLVARRVTARGTQHHVGREAVLVADGGEFGQWAQACVSAPTRLINGPGGSIGSAVPFAIAAKLARPQATVVAMLGDGTFGFHMAEYDTAVRARLPFVGVVGNDQCWNAEHQIQLRAYGAARAHGCELLPTRYDRVAAALGGHGEQRTTRAELEPALERAAVCGLPACVNVAIERLAAPAVHA